MSMSYLRCNWCRQIDLAVPGGEDGPFCAACGSNNCDDWPAPEVQRLLTNIGIGYHPLGHFDLDNPTPHRIGVMLTAIAFERLLEELLYNILYGDSDYNETAVLVETLMESHEGRGRMLGLFKKITGESFATAATAVGYPDFAPKWDTLAQERNRFVHGDRRRGASETTSASISMDLHELGVSGLKVFIGLTNRYAPDR